jgi:UDP-N-acetylglucosamine 2-epimerase (non-hydrolysing)
MKIFILVGTRPNFIKVTRFKDCASKFQGMEIKIIHTGQHYDEKMADIFFRQFNLVPDHYLNISQGSPNTQIAEIMLKLEELVKETGAPDLLLVPGDVNSTLGGALFANKSGIRLGHIEAGLRSFDNTMPEEFNRKLTDDLTDLYFVSEPSGLKHLKDEKHRPEKIHFVGNTMIDTMVACEKQIENCGVLEDMRLEKGKFVLMTMHRPATVDDRNELEKLIHLINFVTQKYRIVFPAHPRTLKKAAEFGLSEQLKNNSNLLLTDPLDYFSFQKLIKYCAFILTDSGGIQEESTFRQKPCLTLRPNTERPVTVDVGTNTLLGFNLDEIKKHIQSIESGTYKKGSIPDLWDGKATERILKILSEQKW